MPSPFTSKFITLLRTIGPTDWKALERWLQSPWCNSNKNLPLLLAHLKPYYPGFSDSGLTKEQLFYQVLPNGKFSDRRMNNLFSEAYLATEKFLLFQRFAQSESLPQILLAQEFQSRGLEDWFFRKAEQEITRLKEKAVKDWEDHLALFRLLRCQYYHPNPLSRISGHDKLVEMDTQIDILYLLEKADLLNEMITRNRLLRKDQHETGPALQKWKIASEGICHPSLDLYRMRFDHAETPSLPQFKCLFSALLERFDLLNPREQKIHLLSLLNDAKQLIKSGKLDITESLPLYQLGLDTGALLNLGKLSGNTYLTIVSASNTKGSFAFTNAFMDQWSDALDQASREDCVRWAQAHTAYWQKDFKTSISILQSYDFQTHNFQLIGRVLAIQVYFDCYLQEASNHSILFQYFDTFEKWLNREKVLSISSKKAFLRFVQICRTLARFHAKADPDLQKLDKLLGKESNIQALNWLKQKQLEVVSLKSKRLSRS